MSRADLPMHADNHKPGGSDPLEAGSGYQFNSGTYGADNVGDYSLIEYTGVSASSVFATSASLFYDLSTFSLGVTSANGIIFTADPDNAYANGQPVLQIDNYVTSGGTGGYGIGVKVGDETADSDGGTTGIGIDVTGAGISEPKGMYIAAVATADATSDVYGIKIQSQNFGSEKAYGGWFDVGAVAGSSVAVSGVASANSTDGGVGVAGGCTIASGAGGGDAVGVTATGSHGGSSGREIGLKASTSGARAGANSLVILCLDGSNNPIFQVREDGSIHGITGGTITWDL